MLAQVPYADPWRFQLNIEVYVLVAFLVGAYVYVVRVIGPTAVEPGARVVTRRNVGCFVGAMVLLGKTYGNLMVDLRVSNVKLRDRAVRFVAGEVGCSHAEAERRLEQCGWKVRDAIEKNSAAGE